MLSKTEDFPELCIQLKPQKEHIQNPRREMTTFLCFNYYYNRSKFQKQIRNKSYELQKIPHLIMNKTPICAQNQNI